MFLVFILLFVCLQTSLFLLLLLPPLPLGNNIIIIICFSLSLRSCMRCNIIIRNWLIFLNSLSFKHHSWDLTILWRWAPRFLLHMITYWSSLFWISGQCEFWLLKKQKLTIQPIGSFCCFRSVFDNLLWGLQGLIR